MASRLEYSISAYRTEIDGLRAVAVWAVILYHAHVPFIRAGFLGVDIFFVISGYLISKTLIVELEAGQFSILKFYERRVRRIIPALVVMTLIFTLVACMVMIPGNLRSFGQSLVATTLSSNNILLFKTTNYFDLSSDLKPLIHTWSLGVEEQYYIVVPLLMLGAFRLSKRAGTLMGLGLIAALSFALCLWMSPSMPDANFYLLFSRAWELAIGAFVALAEPRWRRALATSDTIRGMGALAGLMLIIIPLFMLDAATMMPNAWTVLPVGGTCGVLLFAGGTDPVTIFLSSRAMVFCGLLSYSAYLYHQPLFAFARLTSLTEPSWQLMAALIAASFVCAYLSWHFVEQPFRDRRRIDTRALLLFCGLASLVALGTGMTMYLTAGFPQFWSATVRNDDGLNQTRNAAYVEGPRQFQDVAFTSADPRPKVLVLGDSFARDLINMGRETGRLAGHEISYSDDAGCGEQLSPELRHRAAQASVILVAAAYDKNTARCLLALKMAIAPFTKAHFAIIGTKNFGVNNNAVMLLPEPRRYAYRIRPTDDTLAANAIAERTIPADIFVDILRLISDSEGRVPVFTPDRKFISQDTRHLTRAGARYIGGIVFAQPALGGLEKNPADRRSAPRS